ncbi:MAG: polysaccharide biosynthesis C-terminal domain-containing protein [Sandaracinaceae bacterium]|nr:polysaccharide biosynthesis C-terminal domain-containing protein [Sandaracinaceae bacterium]
MAATLAGVVSFTVISRKLSDDALGAWALLGAAAFLIGLADMGLTAVVQRATVAKDDARARRVLSLSLFVLAVLLPVASIISYLFLIDMDGAGPELRDEIRVAAIIVLVAGMVMGWFGPYRGYVFAKGGVREVARARTAGAVAQLIVTLAWFQFSSSLIVPSTGLLVSYIVEAVITLRAARALDKDIPLKPAWTKDILERKASFKVGAAALAINLAVATALRVDLFVLSSVATLALVGQYGVAGRAVDLAYLLAKQATVALMPSLGDPEHRARAVRIGTLVFSGVVLSGMTALSFDGQALLIGWVGHVAEGHVPAIVLAVLGAAAMIMSLYEVSSSMVALGGRTGWEGAIPIIVGSITNLVISIGLAWKYGIWAVALSTVGGNAITGVLMWRRARILLGWSFSRLFSVLTPSFLVLLASCVVGYSLRAFSLHGTWQSIVACSVTMLCGCLVVALFLRRGYRMQEAS